MQRHCHKAYIGIDVHRQQHKVAIISATALNRTGLDWKNAKLLEIRNNLTDFEGLDTAIKEHILCPKEAAIAIDHTGGHYSEPLVYFLQVRGYDICHLEPKGVKAARERLLDEGSKSDTIDAVGAAYLLYLRDTHGISFRISAIVPELGSRASVLRCLILQRQMYTKMAVQSVNRLRQLLLAVFPEAEAKYFKKLLRIVAHYPTPRDILASQGLKAVKYISAVDKDDIMTLASSTVGVPGEIYRELIRDLSRQRNEAIVKCVLIDELIKIEVTAHPYGHILLSFPCFGTVAAAIIIGLVRDMHRWPNKKKLKKALGIYATITQSGVSLGKGKQGKEGSRHGRRALFQVVLRCIRQSAPDNDFRDLYIRQVANGKPKLKAVVSTMGKLAEVIYYCLTAAECYRYQGKYR